MKPTRIFRPLHCIAYCLWIAFSSFNASSDVVLLSPESPVSIPGMNESPMHVPLVEDRFVTRVLARGNLGESILAVDPNTNQIYFTEYDYSERFRPRRLFTVPPNANNVYVPDETAIRSIPPPAAMSIMNTRWTWIARVPYM